MPRWNVLARLLLCASSGCADAAAAQSAPPDATGDARAVAPGVAGDARSAAPVSSSPESPSDEVTVTAPRVDLLGRATTASQGAITSQEIALRPLYRPSQLFESIPGLVVTNHSGEGKAPQYLVRGYNLDHGTDFANFVDDMPVNRPTNAHGQGYSDLNFLMPQIVGGIDYTKGPYYAGIGDFGSVASAHTSIANEVQDQATVSVGTDGYQYGAAAGTYPLGDARRLLVAGEAAHYDGPWKPGLDFRKVNAALRYSQGDARDGLSVTGLFYKSAGLLTTDQPLRAIDAGLITRFGTLDPTDASRSLRYSLSAHLDTPLGPGQLALSLYGVHSSMTLWNDFTHRLDDPVNGDQEQQDESRTTLGGAASYSIGHAFGGIGTDTVAGLQARYDTVFVDRRHTLGRTTILPYCSFEQDDGPALTFPAVGGYCTADRAHLLDFGPYLQTNIRWTPWLRTVLGLRGEYYHAADRSFTTGSSGRGSQWLAQPKANVVLGPWAKTELYFSYGRGFHSDDVRGVFGAVPQEGVPLAGGPTPLLAATTGYEVGLRTGIVPRLSLEVAAFQQDFGSELTYNADIGQDEAGAPSRRQGVEISGQYHPFRWLELNADLAFSRPRYKTQYLAAFGLDAPYIADAPDFIYSAGVLVNGLGRWSGGLVWRRLGTHHLADGEAYPTDPGYSEFNLDLSYALPHGIRLGVSMFNLFDSHDEAADFYYTSRLPGEPAEGVTDFQVHPLEPRSARFSITKLF